MQPIILLAIVGIAGGAMGVGFLGNTINLDVQLLGVGETDLASPIDNAQIDFNIARLSGDVNGVTETHNIIDRCDITADKDIIVGSHVFCKLTDVDGNVVAEGKTWIMTTVFIDDVLEIDVDPIDFPANAVQNIHDVVLVVQSP